MSFKSNIFILTGAVAMVALGRWSVPEGQAVAVGPHTDQAQQEAVVWTCPMHPAIGLPEFGPCPICGMDLVEKVQGEGGPRQISMSPFAKELSRIRTAPVERRNVMRPVQMVGKVDYDESAVKTISAWVPGRLDRMYVDYTGVRVQEGDHLVWLYSPELRTAQEELLSTRARLSKTAGESSAFLADSNRRAYTAAREKLLLLGLTEAQVVEIEALGEAQDHMMLTSPKSGVVIEKFIDEGAYVQTGTPLYRIADLSHLWVRLDAYEQDLSWLRYGQEVSLQAEALPGEIIRGRISFIDFVIDERTRTAKVRVNVDNSDGRLKPGMFVRAVVEAHLGAKGRVVDKYLQGKWVCPMHPEIVRDALEPCDTCGMDLVPAETLGFVDDVSDDVGLPIVVPRTAVLITGKRAVVYVAVPDAERPTYEGREVVLGPRAGDDYIVLSGLSEGEQVVIHGAFRIDSAMQIQAKPSMMSMPAEGADQGGPELQLFRTALDPLYAAYLALQSALAGDDVQGSREALEELGESLTQIYAESLGKPLREVWQAQERHLQSALESATQGEGIDEIRAAFEHLSMAALTLERTFGHGGAATHYEVYCPMAFDFAGASWLQLGEDIANPYFGDEMLTCGSIKGQFEGSAAQ